MSNENKSVDKILRGEISSVEAYEQILAKVDSNPEVMRLQSFKDDHEKAVEFWKAQSRIEGISPETDSGVWGNVVETFVGASKMFGDSTTLKALKKGEEHGLRTYESLLKEDELGMTQKEKIMNEFIPMQKKHINSIEAMLKLQ